MAQAGGSPALRALVDTNILIRHLTGDPPAQARRSTALLRGRNELILTDVVFAEMIYVLESFYERPRAEIARAARSLLALPSIAVVDHDVLLAAIALYEDLRLDFAEAYFAAVAELSGVGKVVSFDKKVGRAKRIERVEP